MDTDHKFNICYAAATIYLLSNIWADDGFVGAVDELSCYKCKDKIIDPSDTVPNCNRTKTKCDGRNHTCGVITYRYSGAVHYQELCLPDTICVKPTHCPANKPLCYVECCSNDLCNNYTSTNVSRHMRKPTRSTSIRSTPTRSTPTQSTPTKSTSNTRNLNTFLLLWMLAASLTALHQE